MGSRRIPALLSYGVVASVLFVLNCSHGAAGLGDFGLGDCPCTRGLFPVCSTTSGAFVSTSADCAEKCSGVSDVVGTCQFSYPLQCWVSVTSSAKGVGSVCSLLGAPSHDSAHVSCMSYLGKGWHGPGPPGEPVGSLSRHCRIF